MPYGRRGEEGMERNGERGRGNRDVRVLKEGAGKRKGKIGIKQEIKCEII